jgi:RHS repeat-associated protein
VTGTRYYTMNGITVAARTGASGLAYLAGDQQGTSSVAIDSAALGITRRYYDPYGSPRGPAPSSFPVGEKGFIGGAADTATGLTSLGAREYQPATGSFISTDPLLKPYDPQDLNPYAYAQGNPATLSDPTGAMASENGDCGGTVQACGDASKHHLEPPKVYSGAYGCSGATPAEVDACVNAIEAQNKPRGTPKKAPAHHRHKSSGCPWFTLGLCDPGHVVSSIGNGASSVIGTIGSGISTLGSWDLTISGAGATVGECAAAAFSQACQNSLLNLDGCGGQSFTASTKVLLASGQAIPIADVKPGDKVLATDTRTGKTRAETVTAVLIHHDTNVYNLEIRALGRTAVIHTTRNHLFWDATTRRWT